MKKILLTSLALLLAACGAGMDGTYKDKLGFTEYEFKRDGTVYQRTLGVETVAHYDVADDKVRVYDPDDKDKVRLVFTQQKDGSLTGPLGLIYSRAKD